MLLLLLVIVSPEVSLLVCTAKIYEYTHATRIALQTKTKKRDLMFVNTQKILIGKYYYYHT